MVSNSPVVAKRSTILYVSIVLGALAWIAILLTAVTLVSALLSAQHVAHDQSRFGPWTFVGVALIVARALVKWKTVSSVSWSVEDDRVTVHRGWLPWTRFVLEVPIETIFEAYFQAGFFGHFFGYGHCTIRRTEGNTTALVLTYAREPGDIVGAINQKVNDLRRAGRSSSVSAEGPTNTADEIAKLVHLRNQGEISTEVFAALKKKLMDRAVQ